MRFSPPLVVLALSCACPVTPPDDPRCTLVSSGFGPAGEDAVDVEIVTSGLEVPWSIVFLDATTLLVSERPGRLRLVEDGALVATPVRDFTTVWSVAEAGLLGLALHPDFATNRFLYVYVTLDEGDGPTNRVERYVVADDARSVTLDRVILDDIPAFRVHDGGRLRFGPDGLLYVGTGDARAPDDSQNPDSLAGKILRLTPDGEIPDDNPRAGAAMFVLGIRNTQGFDWIDDETLAVADHGPSGEVQLRTGHDELNVARAGDNLGWPTRYACEEEQGLTAPILTSVDAMPPGGLAVVDDTSFPAWAGDIVVGTLGSLHLHRTVLSAERDVARHETYLLGEPPDGFGRLRDVVNGPDGLYVTTSNCDGRGICPDDGDKILRLRPR